MSFLLSCSIKDLIRPHPTYTHLIHVQTNTTLEDTLLLLVQKNVLAVPVLDPAQQAFVGIIDMYQIMTFLAFSSYEPDHESNLEVLMNRTDLQQEVVNLLGNTGLHENDDINSLWNLPSDAPIKEPLEFLGKGVYRILVTFPEGPTRMVTQSDLVRFIHCNIEKFGSYKDAPLSNPSTPNVSFIKPIHTVKSNATALHGFQLMRLKQVNAIGITDSETGKLIGNISDEDLRGITKENLCDFFLTAKEWEAKRGKKMATTSKDTTVAKVIELMINEKVHRVWVIDEKEKVIGVASMTDIALYFYSSTLDLWYPPEEE